MIKIPVGATIAHAYRFAFTEFFTIVKLIWLPFALMALLGIFLGPQTAAISQGIATHDFSAVTMSWLLIVPLMALSWILSFMQITAVFQYALGQPEAQQRWFYFSLARPLWRVIGAFLSVILAILGLALVFVIAAIVILLLFRLGLGAAHISDAAIKAYLLSTLSWLS
jgi:hypothetical protein